MKKPAFQSLWLFTLLLLGAMFLPRLVTQGMFGDGLLYASLARNLAEGRGSMWAPFFSSGYFVEFASGNPYFENPPLMIWTQAGFFAMLGDAWWVEKCYALLLFVLNAWLLVRIWETPLRGTAFEKKYGWLPLLLWYLMPTVIWGNPNNLMDNQLLTFCLLALWCALDGLYSGRNLGLKMTLAGFGVFLALLTKGPVALYPVAAPFLFAWVAPGLAVPDRRKAFLQSVWIGLVAAGLFVLLLALIPDARTYFENYWQKRLGVVISGAREDAALTGWARLSIFGILLKELSVLIAIAAAVYFGSRKRLSGNAAFPLQKNALLFALIGLCATLPLMASARQSAMYILAGLPVFALAAGYYCLPALDRRLEKAERFSKILRPVSLAGMLILAVYCGAIFGTPGRETALLNALPFIQKSIPEGEKVAVCDELMNNLHAHTYLQRFHRLELNRDFAGSRYALTERPFAAEARLMLEQYGFEKVINPTDSTGSYYVYIKKSSE